MPLFFFSSSARFNFHLVDFYGLAIVQPVAILGFFGKLLGAMLPSLYCKLPLTDALILGLIMSSQGLTQLLHLQSLQLFHVRLYKEYLFSLLSVLGNLIWVPRKDLCMYEGIV